MSKWGPKLSVLVLLAILGTAIFSTKAYATENTTDAPEEVAVERPSVKISIDHKDGWHIIPEDITINVFDEKETGNMNITKVEVRWNGEGEWIEVTESMSVTIAANGLLEVCVTDNDSDRYIETYDLTGFDLNIPTVNAAVSNGMLTINGFDEGSGIKSFFVNGYEYEEFSENTIIFRLQQFDASYEFFDIQVKDVAGNISSLYRVNNPYFDDDLTDDDDKGLSTLPADLDVTDPANATALVIQHVIMESADNEEISEDGQITYDNNGKLPEKEFYTIQTDSEKIFYLIIDRTDREEKVYFLTEVSENDLLNVTDNNNKTLPKNSAVVQQENELNLGAIPVSSDTKVESGKRNQNKQEQVVFGETEDTEQKEETEVKKPVRNNSLIPILGLSVVAFVVLYYFRIVKGKKKNEDDEDENDEQDIDDDDEEMEDDED